MLNDPIPSLKPSAYAVFKQMEEKRGPIKGLYRYLFHHPHLANKVASLGEEIRFHGFLPDQIRIFTTLRIAMKFDAQFIWNTHSPFLDLDLLKHLEEKRRFTQSPYKEICSLITHFFEQKKIPDERFFIQRYKIEGYLELVMICAFYQMMIYSSFALNIQQQKPCGKKKN